MNAFMTFRVFDSEEEITDREPWYLGTDGRLFQETKETLRPLAPADPSYKIDRVSGEFFVFDKDGNDRTSEKDWVVDQFGTLYYPTFDEDCPFALADTYEAKFGDILALADILANLNSNDGPSLGG